MMYIQELDVNMSDPLGVKLEHGWAEKSSLIPKMNSVLHLFVYVYVYVRSR